MGLSSSTWGYFQRFEQISGLDLNVSKTVLIPLWQFSNDKNVQSLVKEHCPAWGGIPIATRGKYLGFIIGPGVGRESWIKPLYKFKQRAAQWAARSLGLAMYALVYNIYIVTVLEYVSQVLDVDDEVQEVVAQTLRRIAPGPGNWAKQEDLENLTEFGLLHEFWDIDCTARAAKLRIVNTIAPDSYKKCE